MLLFYLSRSIQSTTNLFKYEKFRHWQYFHLCPQQLAENSQINFITSVKQFSITLLVTYKYNLRVPIFWYLLTESNNVNTILLKCYWPNVTSYVNASPLSNEEVCQVMKVLVIKVLPLTILKASHTCNFNKCQLAKYHRIFRTVIKLPTYALVLNKLGKYNVSCEE